MDINQHLQRKFLVVVDGTPESHAALRFAARRAHGTGGRVALLLVLEPGEFEHWLGIGGLMKEEAQQEAEHVLRNLAGMVENIGVKNPDAHIREGRAAEEIITLLKADKTISTLVLAAGTDAAGPGPLVTQLVTKSRGGFPIPITVVPGAFSDEEIDALT